ncbi:MAG: hypothetical protein QG625_1700 [Cyanobacteriota bacterium erpe_2018_sw_39hr_WHONDRS-SW48-000098_B_bin.30]|nr:hypothetical protein [Cyanobacteriota bacterium erpe_2018_sw_39hr_WHONDRS-SW48-000098_B_bin.30]
MGAFIVVEIFLRVLFVNLAISLRRAIELWPDREACVDGLKRLTYSELGQRVAALTHSFRALGLTKGSVVACMSPNCVEFLELYYATSCLGLVLAPINFRLSKSEISQILVHSGAEMLVTHTDFADLAVEALAEMEGEVEESPLKLVTWLGPGNPPKTTATGVHYESFLLSHWRREMIDCELYSEDLAQLYYTSGTTGMAKGVMLTHGNVAYNALGAVAEMQLTDADIWAHLAPMFHLVDAWAIFAITWVGGKHVFMPAFKADEALKLIETENVTLTALVPTMANALINSSKVWEYSYTKLRSIMTAGSPMAPESVRLVEEIFNCQYVQFYGMTETSPFLTISLPFNEHLGRSKQQLQSIRSKTGRTFIGIELKVVKADGSQVEKNGLEVGEIIARGPNVFRGYWRNEEATKEALRDGWIYTGDLAVVDSDGYVNIVDRKKDMIISGGENIYSTEVEHALHFHADILECAVFGAPDERWGERVKACVVLKTGASVTEAQLIEFVKERLAHYKAPREVEFHDELPKTGSGKILKAVLRDKCWQGQVKRVN